jgi:hypothetical protein
MKAFLCLNSGADVDPEEFGRWIVHDYAPGLAENPKVGKLVANLVQAPPDFIAAPPSASYPFRPYDALLALWWQEGGLPSAIGASTRFASRVDIFHVEEIREKNELPETGGAITPGIKNLPVLRFKPDISAEDAKRKWEAHALLGTRIHTGMRRYVRNIVTSRSEGAPEVDGIAEVSFGTLDDLRYGLFPTAEDRAAFVADVTGFVQSNVTHYSREHVIKW